MRRIFRSASDRTIFGTFSDRFQNIDFRENGLKSGLNVSDRFKTKHNSAINIYPLQFQKDAHTGSSSSTFGELTIL